MIAVIANQGVGKTSMRENLMMELSNSRKWVKSIKWRGVESIFDAVIDGGNENMQQYQADVIYRANDKVRVKQRRKGYVSMHFEKDFEKSVIHLSKRELREIKYDAILNAVSDEKHATLLIEFPDYDKKSRGQMLRDLSLFREWWDDAVEIHSYMTNFNLVIFFQKELWGGHFAFGKFDIIELKPLTPQNLMISYGRRFGTLEPFTEEALSYLGGLARGVPRWFKKYIRVCLDSLYDLVDARCPVEEITVDQVREWVTLDLIAGDWERELMEVFPKSKGLRRKAVEIMRHLYENREATQKQLTAQFFGDDNAAQVTCGRLIAKLIEHDYVVRDPAGREKKVRLVLQYE